LPSVALNVIRTRSHHFEEGKRQPMVNENANRNQRTTEARTFWTRLLWWTLFAAAFGYVEAAVVIYLRRVTGMAPGLDYPAIFRARGTPFHTAGIFDALRRQGVLPLELGREMATLLLLLGAACGAGRSWRERLGLFGYAFAAWDLTYYLGLFFWIGFPRSLQSTDIYFLVPIAWYGPVWFPVLVCMPIILAGSVRLLIAHHKEMTPCD
jgi:hypothetical protein